MKQKRDSLKDVKVTFGKDAFAPKVMYCSRDRTKMKKVSVEMPVSEFIKIKLNVF